MNTRPLVVWGNCQAPPIAALIRAPLAARGIDVLEVPPVYLITAAQLARVYADLPTGAALVAQPVRDDYRVPGCGTDQLARLLPADAQVVTFPVLYDVAAFPYQVRGYDGAGGRVDAPTTDYHDLRILQAAARGTTAEQAVASWPQPSASAVRGVADASRAELQRRERALDVPVSDLLGPGALWTMTHPSNAVLGAIAQRVLQALGVPDVVTVPATEFLGQRQAPVEPAVVEALGWPSTAGQQEWVVDGAVITRAEVVARHLRYYAGRPDVVSASLSRSRARALALGLDVREDREP